MTAQHTLARTWKRGAVLLAGALVLTVAEPAAASEGGTGPYPAEYETTWRLPDHTIYRPQTLPEDTKLPIVVWGNGACSADGTMFEEFLTEIASHGYLVIAGGSPGGFGRTDAEQLTEAIDWAVAENDRSWSDYAGTIDTTEIAVMGQSCGGLQTYEVADDPRITTTVLWNSGSLDEEDRRRLDRLHAPIAYFVGGPDDIAYPNAMADWERLPDGLPAFMGNLEVGHSGTFGEPNGGEFGRVGVAWLEWRLRDDPTAARRFLGSECGLCSGDWEVRRKNLG